MKQYLIDRNSESLLIFFTGWGCDESEFDHLESNSDVLILYNYSDLKLDFDFSKYKKFNLISFSAGVFIASIMEFDFDIDNKIAISGNPYLFDEKIGLSKEIQEVLSNITEENANDFARNYLIETEEEWKRFHHSKRSLDSCKEEFVNLKNLYDVQKQNIKDLFNCAIIGENDKIFSVSAQKEFYGSRLQIIKSVRHNMFFRINNYEQIFELIKMSKANFIR